MEKSKFLVLIFLAVQLSISGQTPFSGTSANFTTDSKPPEVAVLVPNGGEVFNYLDSLLVTWTATDESFGTTPISIGISTEVGGAYTIVASNLVNNGSAMVNPPGVVTNFAKIKVIGLDDFGIEGEDESDDYFTLDESFSGTSVSFITDSKPPVISVISPNGGEAYFYADPLQVKWDATDDSFGVSPVTISVSTDGGATYTDVASGLPNTDSAYVAAPQEISDLALVKVFVQDQFGLTAYDESDAVFTLQGISVDLKAFFEGPFAGAGMLAYLNFFGYVPLAQPYDAEPWNYTGTESVAGIPNDDVVDWVLIEIREAQDAASATGATMLAQQAAFILNDGSVVGLDGSAVLQFGNSITENLYAVVWHRNHLGIMSNNPLTVAGNDYSYDFTTGANQIYGGSSGAKELAGGIWGMVSGDGDADGQINNEDKIEVWQPQSGNAGYLAGDFNMNANADNNDKNDIWEPNSGSGGQVPDGSQNDGFKCQVP
ncbi:MAG: hypothetical protein K8R68_08115 [Bacteroidales bacterium]|nr:hypothetical protein [Bacteroidales bacterium]